MMVLKPNYWMGTIGDILPLVIISNIYHKVELDGFSY